MNSKQALFVTIISLSALCAGFQSCSKEKERPRVTIFARHQPLERVIKEIRNQTNYDYIITQDALDKVRSLDVRVVNTNLDRTLDLLLKDTPLTYEIVDNTIVFSEK